MPDLPPPASVGKGFRAGTHRFVEPQATLERVRGLLHVFGITRVANVTGLDVIGVPVVMVCRPNARSIAVSQGKGADLVSAKVSGIMEAIELHHAERITLPLKLASYNELRFTHRMADVEAIPRCGLGTFHPSLRLLWIEGVDMIQRERVWVPYESVHMNFSTPLPPGSGVFLMGSTGLASGNHPLEAVSHAICEVVERDAATLWHQLPLEDRHTTRLELATVDDPLCRQMLEQYQRAGFSVSLWDMTTDVGIAAFRCRISMREASPFASAASDLGMGCHPAREVALLRALTEAAQSRLTRIAGSRDDLTRQHYRTQSPVDGVGTEGEAAPGARSFQEVPTWQGSTFDEDVAWELERLRAAGCRQVVAVELTKPEFQLPVVRVLIPGLEGCHEAPGFVPGARALRQHPRPRSAGQ